MIRVRELTKRFPSVTAVDKVDLNIEDGEIFGLVGPDGAGKTTLIRMILDLITPTAGGVEVMESRNVEAVKHQIGYIPQKFSLYRDLSVRENIRMIGSLYGADAASIEKRGTDILTFTNLLPFADRLADNLSGGMKQKLALAAGLMHRPKLFFLDEPTTGVDPVSRREFWQMLYRLNKDGMTVFVSTPYMDEAELCSRIAFMHQGRIVSCDTPTQLKQQYRYRILELSVQSRDLKRILADCGLVDVNVFGEKYHLVVNDPETAGEKVKTVLRDKGFGDAALTEIAPTLEDVFVSLAKEDA